MISQVAEEHNQEPDMATHKAKMTLSPREIKRADASFAVERDGKKFGTLEISNGSTAWFPHTQSTA